MTLNIDTAFNVYSDTPAGKDPDAHSPTLRRYHQHLWTKPLPNGAVLTLTQRGANPYLSHISPLGTFAFASDAIAHSYRKNKALAPIVAQMPEAETKAFFDGCSTIGAYTIFPGKQIDGKMTINQARGVDHAIKDRFDLTLECIRRHYIGQDHPLKATLQRYRSFFELFGSFKGYVEFFLLQGLVSEGFQSVRFHLPFDGFKRPALPQDLVEFCAYRDSTLRFVADRNTRIAALYGSPLCR